MTQTHTYDGWKLPAEVESLVRDGFFHHPTNLDFSGVETLRRKIDFDGNSLPSKVSLYSVEGDQERYLGDLVPR